MRTVLVFAVGILVGLGIQSAVAQSPRPNLRLNHVGLSVKDLPAALKFYQDKLGFNEVIRNPNGMSAYIQVSRDTFLELQVANAGAAGRPDHPLRHGDERHQDDGGAAPAARPDGERPGRPERVQRAGSSRTSPTRTTAASS